MRFVDLSAPIEPTVGDAPEIVRVEVDYADHASGAETVASLFGVPRSLLRDGEGWASERFTSFGTHNSTHVDAPYHYNSHIEGEPAARIDELPLEMFFGPGVLVDFTSRADGEAISAADMEAAIGQTSHPLAEGDIVLVRTGRDALYGQPDYMRHGPGVTAEATRWLFGRGVRVMGIDAWGWDRPLYMQAEQALAEQRPGIFWEAHQCDLPYCQIERLYNLGALPPDGFHVACFPLRLVGGSAAPARVVAIFGLPQDA